MGALVGLGVGIGVLLIWSAFVVPRHRPAVGGRPGRLTELLGGAGLTSVSLTSLLALCGGSALVTFLAILMISQTPPVAAAFAAMAGYLPLAMIAGRARRRQREFAEIVAAVGGIWSAATCSWPATRTVICWIGRRATCAKGRRRGRFDNLAALQISNR